MLRVAITGARGYLASLIRLYNAHAFEFIPISRKDVDYLCPSEVERYFSALACDVVLHTAADAVTAHCEQDPQRTHIINTESAIAIARVCKARNIRMIFFSSEQCVNGRDDTGPYDEETELISVTEYGRQKAEVDAWIRANMENYIILRLSWMFGMPCARVKPSANIVSNVVTALRSNTPTLFTVHEHRCMTYAQHLADAFPAIIEAPRGVYNFASSNDRTTYEAALYTAKRLVDGGFGWTVADVDRCIVPNNNRYSDRPRDYRLNNQKAITAGFELATFEEDLDRCFSDFGW